MLAAKYSISRQAFCEAVRRYKAVRGLLCPLPALKTRKALKRAALGDRLTLAIIDIPNLVNATGDLIERADTQGDTIVFVIQKRREGP
jgi:tRNA 2-thiouridine synthesizing protein A